jgi:hypothetical protein
MTNTKEKSNNSNNSNNKCAPNLDFENGSCIPLHVLIDMAVAYNKHNKLNKLNSKIYLNDNLDIHDPDEYKNYLIKEFKKRFNDDQKEWIKLKFVEFMSDEHKFFLNNSTFRPDGPKGKFDWLSTLDINKVLQQYEDKYDDFKFLGAVPIDFYDINISIFIGNKKYTFKNLDFDECVKNGINRFGIVFNLDESWKSGSHWVSLYFDLKKKQIYFSDSYGIKPEKRIVEYIDIIRNFMSKYNTLKNTEIRYNKTQHQKGNSECGVYSINFILRLLKGRTFDHITKTRIPDNKVNSCRPKYFKNEIK